MNTKNASVVKHEIQSLIEDVKTEEHKLEEKSPNTNVTKKKLKLSGKAIGIAIWNAKMPIKQKIGLIYRLVQLVRKDKQTIEHTFDAIQDESIDVNTMNKDLRTLFEISIDAMIKGMEGVGSSTHALESLRKKLKEKPEPSDGGTIQRGGDSDGELIIAVLEAIGWVLYKILTSPYMFAIWVSSKSEPPATTTVVSRANPMHNTRTNKTKTTVVARASPMRNTRTQRNDNLNAYLKGDFVTIGRTVYYKRLPPGALWDYQFQAAIPQAEKSQWYRDHMEGLDPDNKIRGVYKKGSRGIPFDEHLRADSPERPKRRWFSG